MRSVITDEVWKAYGERRDVETRNLILTSYLYIVRMVVGRMYNTFKNHAEQDDMISTGTLALMDAIEGFDYRRGIKFDTYASLRVRGSVIDYLRKQDWVPRNTRRAVKNVEEAYVSLCTLHGRPPTDDELAAHIGVPIEELYRILGESASFNIMSYEELLYEVTVGGESDNAEQPQAKIEKKELAWLLADSIDKLSERERLVVSLFYYSEVKSKDIAKILDVSESRVSQIHSKAILKLKSSLGEYVTL